MIKLYKDIIARAFFVALTTLLSTYIIAGIHQFKLAAFTASGAATISIIQSFVLTKMNYES